MKCPEQIWIAGGIGITPFLSMAKSSKVKASLFWSVRTSKEAHFHEELTQAASENFRYTLWNSQEQGYLSLPALGGENSLQDKDIFICGPAALRDSLIKELRRAGVPSRRIHTEEFAFR